MFEGKANEGKEQKEKNKTNKQKRQSETIHPGTAGHKQWSNMRRNQEFKHSGLLKNAAYTPLALHFEFFQPPCCQTDKLVG